jgi:signal transduction histidine kinase/FixJ family two-component response regulator/CheY-like chemotaxis protein
MSSKKKLNVSLISGNRDLKEDLKVLLSDSPVNVHITEWHYESGFLEASIAGTTDVIITDRTVITSGWKIFFEKLSESFPDAFLIFIIPDNETELPVEMVRTGVDEVLSPSSFKRIRPLIHRVLKEAKDRETLISLSNEKYFNDQITNNSRSMISIINRSYVYEKVNASFCNAQNVNVDQIIGRSLAEVWGNETFETIIRKNIDLCFAGNIIRYEANFNTPLFGNRFYEVVFRPISRGTGDISHLLAETFDITDLKASQKIVSELEEEFKKIETNLPIGFLRCEPDGTIIHANRGFLKIIGCDEEGPMTGLNIKEFYTEKGLFEIHLRQLQTEKIKTFGRVPLFTCGGSEIACRISGFVVAGETGTPAFIDFAFEDSSRELMLENRLLQAQKLETIGSLAGGLAHDFNNILATIYGYSELVLEELPKNSPSSEKVIKIITAVTKARSLTNQILTFSRQVEQQKIAVKVYDVLKETIGFIESGKPQNITIISSITVNDAVVFADPTQLFRVFLNLMTNAIQAMDGKGGTLRIGLNLVEGIRLRNELNRDIVADEYALIAFEDTGIGMEPSVIQRIFEPYFTTKEVGKGTGLGLSVVHGIVGEMEGEILVTSKPGKGSVFSLYIPLTADFHGLPDAGEKKLLFITGNRYESKILSIALEKSGYGIIFASDLKNLSVILHDKKDNPDMIIYMDDSEGIKSDDLIRVYTEKKLKTPLILITDNEQFLSKEKLLNSGVAKLVLIKPVSLREIHNAIQMLII